MDNPILKSVALGFPWATVDPFLFCVHHLDHYPRGNEQLGPAASLAGRNLGQDFEVKDGFRMYHGERVPGFPAHPHRGFETVTIVRKGFIDHSDSLGATARFGGGDVQWLTAGEGIVHSEMFPLLRRDRDNPVELFQIWLNLPASNKLVPPHFSMFWSEQIPELIARDDADKSTRVTVIAGALPGIVPPAPPPHSWAARRDSDVAIWTLHFEPHARWTLPPANHPDTVRTLYFFEGNELRVAGERLQPKHAALLRADVELELQAGSEQVECLLLQGRPIAEPVVQYGPFVMNTREQIQQAMSDYQRTRYGGWPWPDEAPVHARERGRFALHADGQLEKRASPL
jgi:redox-sensitive bicupin YhaK (pirin superfamily)